MADLGLPVMPPRPAAPPGGTGMAVTRPDAQGSKAAGRMLATVGIKALSLALPMLDTMSPEGADIVAMLKIASKRFGTASGDLTRSELKSLGERVSPMGSPENPQAMQQAIRSKLGGMGIGGGQAPAPSPTPQPAPVAA